MPKQPKSQINAPPAKLIPGTKDPILSTGPPKDVEDWKVKNARAKELIMSTLVPGSEPWRIAEPLELASDIWKALEARYAPVDGKTVTDVMEADGNMSQPGLSSNSEQGTDSGSNAIDIPDEAELDLKFRREAQARATKEFHESMPSRDQRFLWALLHGGKEETNAWFYGTGPDT